MGIDKERIIYVNKPMQFRSVIVPEQSHQLSDYTFTKEFLLPYQAIKSRVTPRKNKKIYLTRKEFRNVMRCFNEEYFEDFFTAHGFEVFSMEKLSIEEQISLVMGADEIASTMGTLAHWVIFAKPTANFIMLNRTKDYISGKQCMLLEAFNFENYYIVDGSHNFMFADHTTGVCMLGSNKYWKEFVADYFNEQIEEDYTYFEKAIDEYVNCWCQKYSDPEKSKVASSLQSLCRRIIALEKKIIEEPSLITYQTHIHLRGWGAWVEEDEISDDLDKQLDIQAIKINSPLYKIYYSVYYNTEEGWAEEVVSPQIAGRTGGRKSIYGLKIHLDEAGSKEFDIFCRVHKFDGEWTPWAKNGEPLYSHGQKLNAIQIKLKSKFSRRLLPPQAIRQF